MNNYAFNDHSDHAYLHRAALETLTAVSLHEDHDGQSRRYNDGCHGCHRNIGA